MGIENVSAVSSPTSLAFATQQAGIAGARLRTAAPTGQEKTGNINRSYSAFAQLHKINDQINATAKTQRAFEKKFEKLDDYLERMKAQLGKILKQFPPFPPGSEDRVQALRSYAYFRKLIDQLTIPPPDSLLPAGGEGKSRSRSAAGEVPPAYSGADLAHQTVEIKISS